MNWEDPGFEPGFLDYFVLNRLRSILEPAVPQGGRFVVSVQSLHLVTGHREAGFAPPNMDQAVGPPDDSWD